MSTARELLDAYLGSIRDAEAAAALFTPDGAIEIPYLASIGLADRAQGPDEIKALLTGLLAAVPDFRFEPARILIDTPDQVFAEYEVRATTADGRVFEQLYAGRLVADHGRIALVREYLDVVKSARAVLPNGTDDIPA